jgi:hypothetical protein
MAGRKKTTEKKKPDVSAELEGLDININSLGEIQSTYDIDKINDFLDNHVDDKKLHNLDHPEKDGEAEKEKKEKED